jgi:hypothetical protein
MYGIISSLTKNQYHWEEQLWWMIAANFGNPVNTNAFEKIERSIPYTLFGKHRQQFIQMEALLIDRGKLLERGFQRSISSDAKRIWFSEEEIRFKKNI